MSKVSADTHKYMAYRAQTAYFGKAENGSCVRLLRQNKIFLDVFMNISHIVGFSRLTSYIRYMNTY